MSKNNYNIEHEIIGNKQLENYSANTNVFMRMSNNNSKTIEEHSNMPQPIPPNSVCGLETFVIIS